MLVELELLVRLVTFALFNMTMIIMLFAFPIYIKHFPSGKEIALAYVIAWGIVNGLLFFVKGTSSIAELGLLAHGISVPKGCGHFPRTERKPGWGAGGGLFYILSALIFLAVISLI